MSLRMFLSEALTLKVHLKESLFNFWTAHLKVITDFCYTTKCVIIWGKNVTKVGKILDLFCALFKHALKNFIINLFNSCKIKISNVSKLIKVNVQIKGLFRIAIDSVIVK